MAICIKFRKTRQFYHFQVLGRHKEAFHHARTASVLQQHWLEMKNWDLLQDQRKASSRVLDFAEIEQSLEWNGGWDRHISYEETRLCKAAALAERAWLEWEKVIFFLYPSIKYSMFQIFVFSLFPSSFFD